MATAPPHIPQLRIGLQLDRPAGTTGAIALRVAPLDHPVFDPVELEPVVKTGLHQLVEVGHSDRHQVRIDFKHDLALSCVDGNIMWLFVLILIFGQLFSSLK